MRASLMLSVFAQLVFMAQMVIFLTWTVAFLIVMGIRHPLHGVPGVYPIPDAYKGMVSVISILSTAYATICVMTRCRIVKRRDVSPFDYRCELFRAATGAVLFLIAQLGLGLFYPEGELCIGWWASVSVIIMMTLIFQIHFADTPRIFATATACGFVVACGGGYFLLLQDGVEPWGLTNYLYALVTMLVVTTYQHHQLKAEHISDTMTRRESLYVMCRCFSCTVSAYLWPIWVLYNMKYCGRTQTQTDSRESPAQLQEVVVNP